MKLAGRDVLAFSARPDPGIAGILISGEDGSLVAARRAELVLALVGPLADSEMRLTRIPAADLRSDPAVLADAVKSVGFFPGPRAVVVDSATDGLTEPIMAALADWRQGDAVVVVTAGALTAKSLLRKAFEGARNAAAITLYSDPPGAEEIAALCRQAGIARIAADGRAALDEMAQGLDAGAFRQLIQTLGLFKHGDPRELTGAEVLALAPQTLAAESDALVAVLAEGRVTEIAGLIRRLAAQGVGPVAVSIAATRHFRMLVALAGDPGGPSAGMGRVKPPLFGPRRDAAVRHASQLGADRIERALVLLIETDLTLRSASRAPDGAVIERALIRIAMGNRR